MDFERFPPFLVCEGSPSFHQLTTLGLHNKRIDGVVERVSYLVGFAVCAQRTNIPDGS